ALQAEKTPRGESRYVVKDREADVARNRLRTGKTDLVVTASSRKYEYEFVPTRQESKLARDEVNYVLQRAAGRSDPVPNRAEAVSGLMNLVMLPMWLMSGIFFSSERFPEFLQPFIRVLPLTALINALRAVMLEGATLASQWGEVLTLALWGGVSFALALRFF